MKKILDKSRKKFGQSSGSLLPLSLGIASIVFSAPVQADNVVIDWNNTALQAIENTSAAPTVASRELYILQSAEYNAYAAYDSTAISTTSGGTYRRPETEDTLANKEEAISYAAYNALVNLFPTQASIFTSEMTNLGYNPNETSTDTTTPVGIGNLEAQQLIAARANDASNQYGNLNGGKPYSDYTGFTPLNSPATPSDSGIQGIVNINNWQPLIVPTASGGSVTQKYTTPFWGQVTPFALTSSNEFPVSGPLTFDPNNPTSPESTAFIQQAVTVLTTTGNFGANLTPTQKATTQFWALGPGTVTPPGQWNILAQYVSARDNNTLDQDVKMFFGLDGAMLDASITAWGIKLQYDPVRPITAIHYLAEQGLLGSPALNAEGLTWEPYQASTFVTPSFPEYISGHSVFSASAAAVLQAFTGSDNFGDSVTIPSNSPLNIETGLPDVTLSWTTFSDAATQAGLSRLYGGIHFPNAIEDGLNLGTKVGNQAFLKAESYITPVPEPSLNWSILMVGFWFCRKKRWTYPIVFQSRKMVKLLIYLFYFVFELL